MGSPLGPLVANAFMCNIEEQLTNQNKMPAFCKRYVDDTLCKMKVYRKPTDTGLLLHYQSHVDMKCKHSLLKTMLNRAFKLHQECERLKGIFSRLHYPESIVENTITHFIETKVTENACPKQWVSDERTLVRIVVPFKDQKSANAIRHQLSDLSQKIDADVHPVYTSSWLHESTLTSTCGGTQAISNWQSRKGRAWTGSRDH